MTEIKFAPGTLHIWKKRRNRIGILTTGGEALMYPQFWTKGRPKEAPKIFRKVPGLSQKQDYKD